MFLPYKLELFTYTSRNVDSVHSKLVLLEEAWIFNEMTTILLNSYDNYVNMKDSYHHDVELFFL